MKEKHTLYRLFDRDETLLYVGITYSPRSRWTSHKQKHWWPEVNRAALVEFPDRESALRAEAAVIAAERPRYNVQHNRPQFGMVAATIMLPESLWKLVRIEAVRRGCSVSVLAETILAEVVDQAERKRGAE